MTTKTYIISGAGSGIGRAIAQKLADANHTCILLGRNESSLKETLEMLPANNHQILVADIRDKTQLEKAASQLNASFIDGIIANSGVGGENYWGENDRWDEII
ncbi:MAG: SDR family NAD(P)-dependent oxidoreductase, partial [Sphingobacteriaceae bacterium]